MCGQKKICHLVFGNDSVRFLRSKRKQQDAMLRHEPQESTLVAAEVFMNVVSTVAFLRKKIELF